MHDLRFLVTGASGFLGTRLCGRLLENGAEVHATSRVGRESGNARLCWWQADLLEHAAVKKLFDEVRPDIVVHLAGQVTAAPDLQLVLPAFQSLLSSTVNVLVAATESGSQRIVTTGSLTEPLANDARPTPSSPYAAAKWASSAFARMFHAIYETPVVVVRPFMTYGPGQHEAKIVPHVINALLQEKAPALSSGAYSADWVYVDDVVDGMILAATRPGIDGATIDLGCGELTPTREVVESIVEIINPQVRPRFGVLPDRPNEQMRVADTDYALATLGWRATTSLRDGLMSTVRWRQMQLDSAKEILISGK